MPEGFIHGWACDADDRWFCPDCLEYVGSYVNPLAEDFEFCPHCGERRMGEYDE